MYSIGFSNDNTTSTQPRILALGLNYSLGGCYTSFTFNVATDSNDAQQPAMGYTMATSTISLTASPITPTPFANCEATYDICGGCSLLSSSTYYSRVFNNTYTDNSNEQADYDVTNNNVFVAATLAEGCDSEIFLSSVHEDGTVNFSKNYLFNRHDNAMAVKQAANGDLITAGFTFVNNRHVLFLMRTDGSGNLIWYNHYDQTNEDLNGYVVVTETSDGDIVAVGSSNLVGSNSGHLAILRAQSNGTIRYYDEHQIKTDGYPNTFSFIRGILATPSDNGFLICGTTGHHSSTPGNDYYAQLIMRYDSGYTSGSPDTMWSMVYRVPEPGYYGPHTYILGAENETSASFANAMSFDGLGHVLVAGYVVGVNPGNLEYSFGTILTLDTHTGKSWPLSIDIETFYGNPSLNHAFVLFNGIHLLSNGDYVVTGTWWISVDTCIGGIYFNAGVQYTLIASLQHCTPDGGGGWGCGGVNWVNLYGSGSVNYGCSIFPSSNGFISVGYSNANGTPSPNILSVDGSGDVGDCYIQWGLGTEDLYNDRPGFVPGSSTSASTANAEPSVWAICGGMTELCNGSITNTCDAPEIAGIGNKASNSANGISIYPNPATNSLNIDLNSISASQGVISIVDAQGKQVGGSGINIIQGVNHFEMDISTLQPGIYFVKVVDDKNMVYPVTKVQKQ